MANSKGKMFFGWWIVIAMFIIMTFLYTPAINLTSLFTTSVTKELGFSGSSFTLYYTIMALTCMIAAPFVGKVAKKIDIRLLIGGSTVLGALAYVGFSMAYNLMTFYIAAIPLGISIAGAALIPTALIITNWFNEKRGLALGIAMSGSGFGGIILSPVMTALISRLGWRISYLTIAILIIVTILPFVFAVIRLTPAEKGLAPLGEAKVNTGAPKALTGLTQKEAFKTLSFWLFCLAIVVTGIVVNAMIVNLAPYLTGEGMSVTSAGLVLSAASLFVLAGKLVIGPVFDKLNLKVVMISIGICNVLSFLFLMNGGSFGMAIVYTIFTGVGATAATVAPSVLTANLFGIKDFSSIFGTVSLFSSLGAALSAMVASAVLSMTKSYSVLLITLIALAVVALVLFLIAIATKPKSAVSSNAIKEGSATA